MTPVGLDSILTASGVAEVATVVAEPVGVGARIAATTCRRAATLPERGDSIAMLIPTLHRAPSGSQPLLI